MSSEWSETTWGEIATLEYGKAIRDYQNASGGVPVYGTNGPIGWHHTPLCNSDGVVIGRKGAYRGVHYSQKPFFVIDTAFYLKPKIELSARWAYYCLLTYDINGMDSGSAIPSTSRDEFYKLPVKVPALVEQNRIVEALSLLDDRITLLRETNTTLEAIAQALFKSWFVDFDSVRAKAEGRQPEGIDATTAALFPDSFEESELGSVPKGWTVRGLDSIADYLNGLALQKFPPSEDSWLPVIKIAQLRKGDTVGADRAGRNIKPEYVIQNGDVLFSWSGSLEVAIWCGGEGALNQHLFKVTSAEFPKWFYYLWTRQHLPAFQQIAASKATTMGHIQRKHLTDAKVVVPPEEIIQVLGEQIEPLVDRWLANAEQAQTLTQLRDTLFPRLISGQLRLPEAETLVAEAV